MVREFESDLDAQAIIAAKAATSNFTPFCMQQAIALFKQTHQRHITRRKQDR